AGKQGAQMAWVHTASPQIPSAGAEVPRAPSRLPDGSWSHPEAGVRLFAYGAAEIREGASLGAVLSSLEMPSALPRHLPGPWFGAAAFNDGLGPDWAGFSPLRFTLPALLAWSENGHHHLRAFGDRAQERLDCARAKLDVPYATSPSPPAARTCASTAGSSITSPTPSPASPTTPIGPASHASARWPTSSICTRRWSHTSLPDAGLPMWRRLFIRHRRWAAFPSEPPCASSPTT